MSPRPMIESGVNANRIILSQKIRVLRHRYVLLSGAPEHYSRHSPLASRHSALNLAEGVLRVEMCYGGGADALPGARLS